MSSITVQLNELEQLLSRDWDENSLVQGRALIDRIEQEIENEKPLTDGPLAVGEDGRLRAQETEAIDRNKFRELRKVFREKQKQMDDMHRQKMRESRERKAQIISELKNINADTEHIQKHFAEVKKLREEWKELPGGSDKESRDLQTQYSFQLESFHYNAKNFIAFRELDLRKNKEQKLELIEKIQRLGTDHSIRQMEQLIKQYENDWEETGPMSQSEWPDVRQQYKDACRKIYDQLQAHYTEVRKQIKDHQDAKEQLIQRLLAIDLSSIKNPRDWDEPGKQLNECQEAWNKLGYAGEKHNELWDRFKEGLNIYYRKKRDFFKQLKDQNKDSRERKLKLIEEAEALQHNTNWKESTDRFLALQQSFKTSGHSGKGHDQQLWERFRKACDNFFEAKSKYFNGRSQREEENAKLKLAILEELKQMEALELQSSVIAQLEQMQERWNEIREVGRDRNRELNQEFGRVLGRVVDRIQDLSQEERDSEKYNLKIKRLRQSDNSSELVNKEFKELKEQIQQIDTEISNLENNMGFFSKSKSAGSILIEAELKVHKLREKRNLMKKKLELLVKR